MKSMSSASILIASFAMRYSAVLGLLVSLSSRLAFGQTSTDAAIDKQASAASLFDEGIAAYDRGELALAIEKLRAAHAITPSPSVLYNLAQFEEAAGQAAAAFDSFEAYLVADAVNLSPAREEAVRVRLAELRKRVTKLSVLTEPRAAELWLNGLPMARNTTTVEPGEYELVARATGFRATTLPIRAEAGTSAHVLVTLQPVIGVNEVRVKQASAPKPTPHVAPAAPVTSTARYWAPMLVGAAGILVGAGLVTHLVAADGRSEWQAEDQVLNGLEPQSRGDDYWSRRAANSERAREVRHLDGLELGLFVGAAALGAAGVAIWATAPHGRATASNITYRMSW